MNLIHEELSEKIIGAAMEALSTLRPGSTKRFTRKLWCSNLRRRGSLR